VSPVLSLTGLGQGSRVGLLAATPFVPYQFTDLTVDYGTLFRGERDHYIPSAASARLLSRLTVKRDFLRPAAGTGLPPPLADFELWFWLRPTDVFSLILRPPGGIIT
jgi:hypothetical protein